MKHRTPRASRSIHRRGALMTLGALALALTFSASAALADDKPKWEKITSEQGVTVSRMEIPGQGLPVFRGVATFNATPYDILAVLSDTENTTKWMHNCVEARMLKADKDGFGRIVYNRTDAPWPVDDRDVVVHSRLFYKEKQKQVVVEFKGIKSPLQGEIDDAVRMPKLVGHYKLTLLGDNKTRVEYQVNADPGGMLPDWLAASASKDLPLNTLTKLRARVMETKKSNTYKTFLSEWDPAHGGKIKMEDLPTSRAPKK